MFGLPAVAQAAVVTPLNGNFELPAPVPVGGFDVAAFPGWTEFQAASWGASSADAVYRIGTPIVGYPAGADGQTIAILTNNLGPSGMFQDLGTMVAGQKYTFSAAISITVGNTEVNYRFSFIGDHVGDPLITPAENILASITDADFSPPSGGTTIATFDYTPTAADDGAPLRLQLETLGTHVDGEPFALTGVDAVVVSVLNLDTDGDGVIDVDDLCPGTVAAGDTNGCSDAQVDGDGDGICNPGAPSDGPSACTGSDNCPLTANPGQEDSDADNMGDVCEAVKLTPGSTTTLDIDSPETDSDCSEVQDVSPSNVQQFWTPNTLCVADPSGDTPLKVFAVSAFSTGISFKTTSSSLQNLSSTAKLIREMEIPTPAKEPFLSTLRVQVATEVAWSGGFVAAGVASTYAQVVATLQVRDVTDAPTGPVVASNTFFSERFDAQLDLPDNLNLGGVVEALNLVDAVDVSNSSGADVTAFLERGRIYAIELEVKCDVGAPALGFAFCLFAGGNAVGDIGGTGLPQGSPLANVFANDGFQVAPFEVTVDSDPVEEAVNQL